MNCPKCNSTLVKKRNIGSKTGAILGFIAGVANRLPAATAVGAVAGETAAMALLGGAAGSVVPIVGTAIGAGAGIAITALVNGSKGAALGAAAGAVIDNTILDARKCESCGYTFD